TAQEVSDGAERARLAAVAENRDVLAAQRLAHEGGDRAAVLDAHARAVGVEDPHDARLELVVAVVGHGDGLGEALGLVVDAARPDRVDVAPVVLALRWPERVPVSLGGG